MRKRFPPKKKKKIKRWGVGVWWEGGGRPLTEKEEEENKVRRPLVGVTLVVRGCWPLVGVGPHQKKWKKRKE